MLKLFQQVKLSSFKTKNISSLFETFHIEQILTKSKIIKSRGHSIQTMFFCMLILILENSKSVYSGLLTNFSSNMKSPINDMLNNTNYNWRSLLFGIAKRFSKLCPSSNSNDKCLIFDDTSKVKTGRKTQFLSWFRDHCNSTYFKGYQNVTAIWSNGRTAIPVDFELKIGKRRTKQAKNGAYMKGSHTEQRVRFSKKSKIEIIIDMLKRINQRKFPYKFVLWDSWYNCSKSFSYVFTKLVPAGKTLISMMKRGNKKYKYGTRYLTIKELYKVAGRWKIDTQSGIKYKSIQVELLDAHGKLKIKNRNVIGAIKICFFKYPNVKNWKAILTTDRELSELEVLEIYLKRWAIECVFKEIKQFVPNICLYCIR